MKTEKTLVCHQTQALWVPVSWHVLTFKANNGRLSGLCFPLSEVDMYTLRIDLSLPGFTFLPGK